MSYKMSVIIPVYNVEFNIENCFLSLFNQSIGFENLEVICVDDCSTDNTRKVLEVYSNKYKNIKLDYLGENSGVAGKPRNVALDMVTADYVMFVDPDDTLYQNACEVLYERIMKEKADVVSGIHTKKSQYSLDEETFPGLLINTFTDSDDSWSKRKKDLKNFKKEHPYDLVLNSVKDMPSILGNFGLSSKVFSMKFINDENIRFPEYIPGEDSAFLFKSLILARKIVFINEKIYSYTTFRSDEENKSLSFQVDLDKNLGRLKSYKIMLYDSIENNMSYEYVKYILNGKLLYFFESFIFGKDISNNDLNILFDELYELCKYVKDCDVVISNKISSLLDCIVDKDYDGAREICKGFGDSSQLSVVKKISYMDELNVAVIMDTFTYNSYNGEFNAIALEPDIWKRQLDENDIDLLFVESAYHGVCEENIINGVAVENKDIRPWQGKIAVNLNRGWDNRDILFKIIDYCKERDIPTIFWNKEDPVSFDDKKYNFVDTALHFDYIFTTDIGIIHRYNALGHEHVYPLLFATQIKLFNPIENAPRSTDIIFPGSWYKKFNDRCIMMRNLFDKILDSDYNLKIYNRSSDLDIEDRIFPEKYHPYIYPKVNFDKMPSVYKESKFSLNINTVTESYTMFARRVFELMSSNTFVFSNYSKGVYDLFKDNVIYLDQEDKLDLTNLDVDKICEENLYNVLENHTYYQRWKHILDTIQYDYKEKTKKIHIIYVKNKENTLEKIYEDFNNIKYHEKEAIIISEDEKLKSDFMKIMTYNEFFNYSNDFDENDYYLIRNLNKDMDREFIKKALLHYSYIDKEMPIRSNKNKYIFEETDEIHDLLFNNIILDKMIEKLVNYDKTGCKAYNI